MWGDFTGKTQWSQTNIYFYNYSLFNLDYEAGEEEVWRSGDVDGGSVSTLSLILQLGKHHHPPPAGLHHVRSAFWLPLVAAERPDSPVSVSAELPSGETQLACVSGYMNSKCLVTTRVLLTEHPWGQYECEGWGRGRRYLPAHSRSRREATVKRRGVIYLFFLQSTKSKC